MKASEYYERIKNIKGFSDKQISLISAQILRDLLIETQEIIKQRNIQKIDSCKRVFQEQQEKLDAINRLFKARYKCNYFVENAFIVYCKTIPEVKEILK